MPHPNTGGAGAPSTAPACAARVTPTYEDLPVKVALISPKWNQMVNSYPSLGLAYLAAALEQHGHEARVYDFGLDPDRPLEQEVQDVLAFGPSLVGLTSMTSAYHSIAATLDLLRAGTQVPVVIGGPHATVFPERTLRECAGLDYLVVGEGEETLLELVEVIEGRRDAGTVAGLCYRRDGQVLRNPDRPLIRDLDALPLPARHLFQLNRYPLFTRAGGRMLTVLTSRGCPYNCSYCFKGIVGRTYRQRSPENLIAELKTLIATYNIRDFYFIDDLFTLDLKRLERILDLVLAEKLNIRWQCLARVDRVTPEILLKMGRAGCREVHYGIESGNQEILDRVGKRITLEQVRNVVTWTHRAGIRSKGYFMLGLPGDTEETMEQTIQFAAGLDLDDAMFSLTTPFPGTRLWEELVARRPETEFDQDFSKAFYYNSYTEEIAPFMNISEVADSRLSELAHQARARFDETKRKRKYEARLGRRFGLAMWRLSQVRTVRSMGRWLLDQPAVARVIRLREDRIA
jgi:anaerobic magnesium-protoporphyrin IX monomethyl ester cyclase